MTKFEQITLLAATGTIETNLVISCSDCKGACFSLRTTTPYTTARAAKGAGWCATDAGEILCPECARKLQ